MSVCSNCGFDSVADAVFCGNCGTRIGQVCGHCERVNPVGYHFCAYCGQAMDVPVLEGDVITTSVVKGTTGELVEPASEVLAVAGTRKVASVIVADVQGSTDLLDEIGTERWVTLMNQIFQRLESEIVAYGGGIDQFRGDGLVAFFGAMKTHEDDPERAVAAALGMQRVFAEFVAGQAAAINARSVRLRVGVSTGEVVAGRIGNDSFHSENTAMGEAVAVAARMESAAEPGTVLVAEGTYAEVKDKFTWKALGEIRVKGIKEAIAVYRPLEQVHDVAEFPKKQLLNQRYSVVGREKDIATLQQVVTSLVDGRGSVCTITGDKGMGKTWIVDHVRGNVMRDLALRKEVLAQFKGGYLSEESAAEMLTPSELANESVPEVLWLKTRCRSYQEGWGYEEWNNLLRNWLNIQSLSDELLVRDRLLEKSVNLWGDRFGRYYPYLVRLMGLPEDEQYANQLAYLDEQGLNHQTYRAVWNWLLAMAQQERVMLVFSDVQWINHASLSLLQYCLPLCEEAPISFLITYRLQRETLAWDLDHLLETRYPHRLERIELKKINKRQSGKWVNDLVGADVFSKEERDLLIEKSEGNPYFMRLFLEEMVSSGVLVKENEAWRLTRKITSLDVPDNLQTMLFARLDRLSESAMAVLQAASVLGSVFWDGVLAEMVAEPSGLQKSLNELLREDVIRQTGLHATLGETYRFSSMLLRDVLYDSLLNHHRQELHARAGTALERLLTDYSNFYSLLAYQFHAAGDVAKELQYTVEAAQQAQNAYANNEAIHFYSMAIRLLYEMEEDTLVGQLRMLFACMQERTRLFYEMGRKDKASLDAHTLQVLANKIDAPAVRVEALLLQPEVVDVRMQDDLAIGIRMMEEALGYAEETGDDSLVLRCRMQLVQLKSLRHSKDWWDEGEAVLAMARAQGNAQVEMRMLLMLAKRYGVDQLDQSLDYLEQAQALSKQLDGKVEELEILNLLGAGAERDGDYYALMTDFAEARLNLAREIGSRTNEGWALLDYGLVRGLYLGDVEGAMPMLQESLRIRKYHPDRIFCYLRLAQVAMLEENEGQAAEFLRMAQEVLPELETVQTAFVGVQLVKADFAVEWPKKERLIESVHDLVQVNHLVETENLLSRQYRMGAAIKLAKLYLAMLPFSPEEEQVQLRWRAIEESWEAVRLFEAFGFTQMIECVGEEIYFVHAKVLRENGYAEDADAFLRKAHAVMMAKWEKIPAESGFRETFLGLPLHVGIMQAVEGKVD